ncbi:MAG: rod shape-determining protein MreD [Burkholderiales bacterium]
MASVKTTLSKPASGRFILFTLVLGLLANLVPWSGLTKLLWPDAIALLLVYWITYQPRHVGLGTAWFLGLLMDIADGVLFGQHALAYTLMAYMAQILHRRIQMLSPWQQSFYVFGLLLILLVIMLVTRLAFGAAFPGPLYFASSVIGAVLWPSFSLLLRLPQHRKSRTDDTFTKLANK